MTYEPDYAVPPGETLRETLDALGMAQSDLALRTGRPTKTINEIVNGKAAITPETALQFERVLGVPASFWNNLQRNYEGDLARIAERSSLEPYVEWLRAKTVKEVIRRGWVRACEDEVQQLREISAFLRIASPRQWHDCLATMAASFRRSAAFESDPEALVFWLRKGEIDALGVECAEFDARSFRGTLEETRSLTLLPLETSIATLVEICAAAGVAVLFVPELPKTRVSGATRWLTPTKALIQLSFRHKTDDHLWFSFFHEAAHVLLHQKRPIYLDLLEGPREAVGPEEKEADAFARDRLIPPDAFGRFISGRTLFSKTAVRRFAQANGIAPGIVVGRLQHDRLLPHSHCNDLKRKVDLAV